MALPSTQDILNKISGGTKKKTTTVPTPFAATKTGMAVNTAKAFPGALKETLKETFFPTRGYTEEQLKQARPTIKETVTGTARAVAEIPSSIGQLATLIPTSQQIQQKIAESKKTPLGKAAATIGQKVQEFAKPKTVGEAKAMRAADVVGVLPVGSLKKVSAFKNFPDLSTKLLGKLEGRTTVSRQFIEDLTNSPDLKQPERDLFRNLLKDEGDDVDVPTFANKVKMELLPLKRGTGYTKSAGGMGDDYSRTRYENITLPDEQRGRVSKYSEHIYNSPIKTSAGEAHFSGGDFPNYFAHSRIEDLPLDTKSITSKRTAKTIEDKLGNKKYQLFENDKLVETTGSSGKAQGWELANVQDIPRSGTRRVIEIQSDLFQKGRLEGEKGKGIGINTSDPQYKEYDKLSKEIEDVLYGENDLTRDEKYAKKKVLEEKQKALYDEARAPRVAEREKELSKLEPYRNTWHERVIKEEVKQAAKDGKTKLQFPTGETAMKIEGLGETSRWDDPLTELDLKDDALQVGKEIVERDRYDDESARWIITKVYGDGKFQAIPKNTFERFAEDSGKYQYPDDAIKALQNDTFPRSDLQSDVESFDISGKVDTNNPIYRFYEKEVGRYLKNKYNAQLVTDAQGVKWWEVDLKGKGLGEAPIEAFGAVAGFEQDEEGNLRFSPEKAALGVAGASILRRTPKSLIEEARKYKSAEEFVNNKINVFHATSEANAKGIEQFGFKPSLGRGLSNQPGDFAFFTPSVDGAMRYSKTSANNLNRITSGSLKGNILKIDGVKADFEAFGEASRKLGVPLGKDSQGNLTMLDVEGLKKALRENGYSAIEFKDRYSNGAKAIAAIPEEVLTKSQLTDLWNKATITDVQEVENYLKQVWYRGEDSVNADKGSKFFSTSEDVAGDYGTTRKIKQDELPTNPLLIKGSKDDDLAFQKLIGYDRDKWGSPFMQPKDIPKEETYDYLIKKYAINKGHDGIIYTDGSLNAPELVVFPKATKAGVPTLPKTISTIDQLIADNIVRVVSRNGRDTYQIKKGTNWLTVRDEDSAIKQLAKPAVKKALPEPVQAKLDQIDVKQQLLEEELAMMKDEPIAKLSKYEAKRGDFKGGLPQVLGTGKSKFGRVGDQLTDELGMDSETAREAYDQFKKRRETKLKQLAEAKEERKAIKRDLAVKPAKLPEAPAPKSEPIPSRVSVPRAITEGEAKSLEIEARKTQELANQGGGVNVPSLNNIIQNSPTPVNKKVNIIDYIRTPNRVLEKIGLGKEAKLIRQQYDKYVQELPKNIEKITQWSKQVPKQSSERIFKYLDGQAIDLRPEEKKVAIEIKDWLSQWADRLNLPKDNRIAEYITHIFDDQLIKKEFDEDLAKIITDKVPGSVYDPFLLKRLGAKGYKQDVWAALDAYVKRATRKVHVDPALEKLEEASSGLELSQWNYVKRYADNINMRPTDLDNLMDNALKSIFGYKLGQRPSMAILGTLRRVTYRALLGLNPGSALRNLSQGSNIFAKIGTKYTAIGYAKLLSPSARKEIIDQGVLANNFIQDRTLSAVKEKLQKIDKGLFILFDTVEKISRGAAYLGGKAKSLAQGMSEKDAIEYGKKLVRDTQFAFDSVDTPVILQSEIAKTLGQLQSYTTKQIEFLTEMAKNKEFAGLIRYTLAGLTFVYTIGQAFGMEPKELLPIYRLGVPPSLKFPAEVVKAVVDAPDKYGNQRDLKQKATDVAKTLTGLIPAGTQIKKTYEGFKALQDKGALDKSGRLLFPVGGSKAKTAQALLFGKYASKEAKEYFKKEPKDTELSRATAEATKKRNKAKQEFMPTYKEIRALVEDGKDEEARAKLNALTDEQYDTYKSIRTVEKTKETKELQEQFYPTYLEIRALVDLGRDDEAKDMLDSLSDEEYKAYKSLKERFGG